MTPEYHDGTPAARAASSGTNFCLDVTTKRLRRKRVSFYGSLIASPSVRDVPVHNAPPAEWRLTAPLSGYENC